MSNEYEHPWQTRLEELLQESRVRTLADAERTELNAILRHFAEARAFAAVALFDDAVMADELGAARAESAFRMSAVLTSREASPPRPRARLVNWRTLIAAAAGLVVGVFGATIVFGYVMPRSVVTASRLFALQDGSFEAQAGRVASGFPAEFGCWGGDHAESSSLHAADGGLSLRFVKAELEPTLAGRGADSCDLYQLVDLRPLKANAWAGESTLELSARFLDVRTSRGAPLKFICRLHVFSGKPDGLPSEWPLAQKDALSSASGTLDSEGGRPTTWQTATARVLLPKQADFAVVHLVMHQPEGGPGSVATFGDQFVDDVGMTLKTQPMLPVRLAHE